MKLVMISGSFEYDSEQSLNLLKDYLKKNYGVDSDLIVYKDEDDHPSLKPVEDADVLLVFARRINESGEELERLKAYCEKGRPIVGVRTASHAYQNWLEFDKKVLGGNYQDHYGAGPECRVEIEERGQSHQILNGVSSFVSSAHLYRNAPIAADSFVLMTGYSEDHVEPVAWTRMHNGGRVFYTSLGNQADFTMPVFLRMLSQAVSWAHGI